MTNAPRYNVAFLDARHRARGRCENRIKTLKNTGLGKFPYFSFATNEAWTNLAMFAMNLVAWIQLAILPAGHAAGVTDIKRWRYRLFSTPGKLIRSSRQTRLLLPRKAPEAELIMDLHVRIDNVHQRFRHGDLAA